ncbi:MAG: rhomboid family intramembrane serine protease [Elainellaceae cyanobacterium]
MIETKPLEPKTQPLYNGVFILILINLALFIVDHVFSVPLGFLYLNQADPAWYQFITAMFCHANWAHLSGNLFLLYIFGKIVEEEEGAFGVIASYVITGLAANLLSWILQPAPIVSLGASGAVFGLFAVSVLIKLSWNWRKLLEVLILGQFVISQVWNEVQQVGLQDGVNRIAHLGGALAGVALIFVLMRLVGNQD